MLYWNDLCICHMDMSLCQILIQYAFPTILFISFYVEISKQDNSTCLPRRLQPNVATWHRFGKWDVGQSSCGRLPRMKEKTLKEKAFGSFPFFWLRRQMQCQEIKPPNCDQEEESHDGSGRLKVPGSLMNPLSGYSSSKLSSSGLLHMWKQTNKPLFVTSICLDYSW